MTLRHDYGLDRDADDPPWTAGMSQAERKFLWDSMAQVFDNDIAPYMEFKNGQ
jgi:hypothetical protein